MSRGHQIVASFGAALGVATLALGGAAIVGHRSGDGPARAVKQVDPTGVAEQSAAKAEPTSVAADEKCSATSTPQLPADADPRIVDAMRSTQASQADPKGKPLSRDTAIETARQIARPAQEAYAADSKAPDLTSYPAVATQLTFKTADRWMPGSSEDSLVAPTRCVWMVTVDAPFQPRSAPANGMSTSYDSYTVLFDVASGEYLGVGAGSDTPNLISGKNVGADN